MTFAASRGRQKRVIKSGEDPEMVLPLPITDSGDQRHWQRLTALGERENQTMMYLAAMQHPAPHARSQETQLKLLPERIYKIAQSQHCFGRTRTPWSTQLLQTSEFGALESSNQLPERSFR
jgi:hypothetical protein